MKLNPYLALFNEETREHIDFMYSLTGDPVYKRILQINLVAASYGLCYAEASTIAPSDNDKYYLINELIARNKE